MQSNPNLNPTAHPIVESPAALGASFHRHRLPSSPRLKSTKPRHPEGIENLRNDRIRKNKKNYARPTRATSHRVLIRQLAEFPPHLSLQHRAQKNRYMGGNHSRSKQT